tara:strand:- start:129 stop:530 length:402 start_codon:yes stop_codon:yes gene_type:complete
MMDYSKLLRFLIIFMIIALIGLLVLVNFFSEVAFEFYDIYPGEIHGFINFVTYPSILYLFTIVLGFKYLGTNNLEHINTLIIIFTLFAVMRTYGLLVDGLNISLFVIMAYPAEFLGAPVFYFLKKKIENSNNF